MSIARWNLKEAAGKALIRRTGIAYEAAMPDEKANIFKVPYLCSFRGTAQAFRASLTNEPFLILAALLTVYIVLGVL